MDSTLRTVFAIFSADFLATIALLALIAWAIREDAIHNRIPNALTGAGFALGLGLMLLTAGVEGLVRSAGGALVGGAIFIPFYLLRGMSAGDVKLMGASGAFLGPSGAAIAAALSLVAGCLLAIAMVGWQVIGSEGRAQGARQGALAVGTTVAARVEAARKQRFPYAGAIGAGVVATLWLQGSLVSLAMALGIG